MGKLFFFFLALLLFFKHTYAKKEEPIIIEAKEFVFTGDKYIAIYKGNAKIRKGDFKLSADELKVFLTPKGEIDKLVAKGHVKFSYSKDTWGQANYVYIDLKAQKITLKGNAELHQKNTAITGDQIIFYMKENRVVVYGGKGKKVRTIIIPQK